MRPKSVSVGSQRPGIVRTTARKRVPVVPPKYTSIPKSSAYPSSSSSQDNHLTPPRPTTSSTSTTTTTAASLEFSQNDSGLLFSSPEKKRVLKSKNYSPGKSFPHVSSNAGPQEKALISVSPDQISVGDKTQEKTLVDSSNLNAEVGIRPTNSIPANGQEVTAKDGHEIFVGSEKAAVDADGQRIVVEGGKRKVIKRVKVIKKVVKRVIKKVPKGSLDSLERERVGNASNLNENIQNLETELDVSQSMQIEKVDPIGIDSVKHGKFEPDDVAPLGVENGGSKEIKVDSTEVENVGPFVEHVSPMGISSEVPLADNYDGKEGEGIQNQIEDDEDGGDFVEEQNAVLLEEGATEVDEVQNQIEDEKDSGDVLEDQNAVPVEEGASEVEEVVKEFVENNGAGLSGGVVMSGEMEAVERRKRRQTEIFLGGLDKDAKEEDIRKVFEQVGEVTEVRLRMNSKTGKNKGFAFVRFASAADAKKALAKYSKVEICGKQCTVQPVEGNDTLFLGNINKKWKDDDVIRLLKHAGIEKIDKVTVKANPNDLEQNWGFAFVELETRKDAQIAYKKLQKNFVFNKQLKIKVAWAQPLVEPDEKQVLKVKSVYAEYIPSFWDEEKVKIFFKRFGEIESITLAKNLPSSRRKDFAFVTYNRREAALACVEAFSHEQVHEDGSKVNVKVSLANPQKKSKQIKHVSSSTEKELSKDEPKTPQSILKVHGPRKQIQTSKSHEVISDRTNSTTVELIHLLRQQQASGRPMQAGSSDLNYHHSSSGSKRTFHELDDYALSSDPRGFLRTRRESSPLTGNPSSFSHHIGRVTWPYPQQRNFGHTFESSHGIPNNPYFQTRGRPLSFGHSNIYQRCM